MSSRLMSRVGVAGTGLALLPGTAFATAGGGTYVFTFDEPGGGGGYGARSASRDGIRHGRGGPALQPSLRHDHRKPHRPNGQSDRHRGVLRGDRRRNGEP